MTSYVFNDIYNFRESNRGIEVDVYAGSSIHNVATQVCLLADSTRTDVYFAFNDVLFWIPPGTNDLDVVRWYFEELDEQKKRLSLLAKRKLKVAA